MFGLSLRLIAMKEKATSFRPLQFPILDQLFREVLLQCDTLRLRWCNISLSDQRQACAAMSFESSGFST